MSEYRCTYVRDGRGGQIPFPPFVTQEVMDSVADGFSTLEDDIFVVAYPKCGTTWLEQVVHLILNQGVQGEKRITDAAPWLETLPDRPGGMQAFLQTLQQPRLFTSHLPLQLMPDFSTGKGNYIYVARNPKDTAVSYYHHDRSKLGYEGSWAEHFALFLQGKLTYGDYFDHVLAWWEASQTAPNILFLKYEAMKRNLTGAVAHIAEFIDVPLSQTLQAQVVAGSTFAAMASNKKTNFDWVPQREGVPTHFRKGIVGDWRSQFTPEQSRQLDELYAERMKGSQLKFDFGKGEIA